MEIMIAMLTNLDALFFFAMWLAFEISRQACQIITTQIGRIDLTITQTKIIRKKSANESIDLKTKPSLDLQNNL